MKFLQETRGYDMVTNRCPPPKTNALFLLQLRSHVAEAELPQRRKLGVAFSPADLANEACRVKIVHTVE